MITVIVPAYYKEEPYLNRTIDNIFRTAEGEVEVLVFLNGYTQKVDERAKVLANVSMNVGERTAMNCMAKTAKGEYLLRIDAHCDFLTPGWDKMMVEVTGPKTITVAILVYLYHSQANVGDEKLHARAKAEGWKDWHQVPGHWYGMCRLMPNMEAKWLKPNKEREYPTVVPNMCFTGCGWLIPLKFYWELGGADEMMPEMGAIGEEFAVKAWLNGGKVQSRTDVEIGHIFATGGYDTQSVVDALKMLEEKYGDRYHEIKAHFPDIDTVPLKPSKLTKEARTVTVDRYDTTETKDTEGVVIRKTVNHFRHVWIDDGSESKLTDDEIRQKYAPIAHKIGEEIWLANDAGELVKVEPKGE